MPEKPKEEKDSLKETEKPVEEKPETASEGNCEQDRREKSYYYDDAHGYEVYNPDDDDEQLITDI